MRRKIVARSPLAGHSGKAFLSKLLTVDRRINYSISSRVA